MRFSWPPASVLSDWFKFMVPMQIVRIESRWSWFELGDLCQVFLIVNAVAEQVTKTPQGSLQSICGALFLSFLESRSFAFAILDVAISDILHLCQLAPRPRTKGTDLVIRSISQCYPQYNREAECNPSLFGLIDLQISVFELVCGVDLPTKSTWIF